MLDKFNLNIIAIGKRDPINRLCRFGSIFEVNSTKQEDKVPLWQIKFGYLNYFGLGLPTKEQ